MCVTDGIERDPGVSQILSSTGAPRSTSMPCIIRRLQTPSLDGGCDGKGRPHTMPLLDPQHPFAPNWTFDALLITCIGGGGTLLGPILGAVFYTLPKEYLALHWVDFHLLVFGALFMAIVLALPGGLGGTRRPPQEPDGSTTGVGRQPVAWIRCPNMMRCPSTVTIPNSRMPHGSSRSGLITVPPFAVTAW